MLIKTELSCNKTVPKTKYFWAIKIKITKLKKKSLTNGLLNININLKVLNIPNFHVSLTKLGVYLCFYFVIMCFPKYS